MSNFTSWRYGAQIYVSNLIDLRRDLEAIELRLAHLGGARRGLAIDTRQYCVGLGMLIRQTENDIISYKSMLKDAAQKHDDRRKRHLTRGGENEHCS